MRETPQKTRPAGEDARAARYAPARRGVYRRRRLAALVALAALALSLHFSAGAKAGEEAVLHTVAPGDTLWSIAADRTSFTEDPRVTVEEVRRENALSGYEIQPGQVLKLPA